MKKLLRSIVFGFLALTIVVKVQAQSCPIVPFAVVELFTSQGCSSCPPAETGLNTVIAAEKTSGRNVICIAEHVHYWDNSSWTDPYSDPQFSPRQTIYCQKAGVQKGTPEAFVNGKQVVAPFPYASNINTAINNQLGSGNTPTVGVCLTLQTPVSTPTLTVSYEVSGAYAGNDLIICLVEDKRTSKPSGGENSGVTLNEDGVSRVFMKIPVTGSMGTVDVIPPANCIRANAQIVAYVQNPTSMVIYGATRGVDLGSATTGVDESEVLSGLNVFPNPASSDVTIEGNAEGVIHYSLCNILGEELMEGNIESNGSTFTKKIQLDGISDGMYLLKVESSDSVITKKLQKR